MNREDRAKRITIGSKAPPNSAGDYLFDGILPRRGLVFVLGAPKVGKSLFIMWLAGCLATGQRLFPSDDDQRRCYGESFATPTQRGGVLYVAAEDGDIAYKRVAAMRAHIHACDQTGHNNLPDGDLPIIVYRENGLRADSLFSVENDIKESLGILERTGFPVRLIVFDTLAAAFAIRDENDNAKMQEIVRVLRAYAAKFDALVVATAHPKKNGRRQSGQVRGAGSITASADAILELTRRTLRNYRTRCSVRIASVRDGACEGERFEFQIGIYDGQPAMYPVQRDRDSNVSGQVNSTLTSNQFDLLRDFETWSNEFGVATTLGDGRYVYGISLEHMVRLTFEAHRKESGTTSGTTTQQAKDKIRKRVGRSGLNKLASCGLCEQYVMNGKPYFRPTTDWDDMTTVVAKLAPESEYKSYATVQREQINWLNANSERNYEAMSKSVFYTFVQCATRIKHLDRLRNRPS